ncbi:MAG: SwmB domain-containing protein [Pseudomonadota bacterium]
MNTLFSQHNMPVITSVSCDGYRLILQCDQSLDLTVQPSADDFSVDVTGQPIAVLSAYVRQFIHEQRASIVLGLNQSMREQSQVKVSFQPKLNSVVTEGREPLRPFIDTFVIEQLPERVEVTHESNNQPWNAATLNAPITPTPHRVSEPKMSITAIDAADAHAHTPNELTTASDELISFESVFSSPDAEQTAAVSSHIVDFHAAYSPPQEQQQQRLEHDILEQEVQRIAQLKQEQLQQEYIQQEASRLAQLEQEKAQQYALEQARLNAELQQQKAAQQEALRISQLHEEQARQDALAQARLTHELEQKEREQQEALRVLQLHQEQARQDALIQAQLTHELEQKEREQREALALLKQQQAQVEEDARKHAELKQTLEQQVLAQQAASNRAAMKQQRSQAATSETVQYEQAAVERSAPDTHSAVNNTVTSSKIVTDALDLSHDLDRLVRISGQTHALLDASETGTHNAQNASASESVSTHVAATSHTPHHNAQQSAAPSQPTRMEVDTNIMPSKSVAQNAPLDTPEPLTDLHLTVKGKRVYVHGISGLDWRRQPKLEDFSIAYEGKSLPIKSVFVTKKGQNDGAVLVFVSSSDNMAAANLSVAYLARNQSLKHQKTRGAIPQFEVGSTPNN